MQSTSTATTQREFFHQNTERPADLRFRINLELMRRFREYNFLFHSEEHIHRCLMRTGNMKPKRILVVEDDPDILNSLNIIFGSRGFHADVMLRGKSILQDQFEKPDLFILDKQLPDVDGLEICRYLKSSPHYHNIPIIVISASPRMKSKGLEAGASFFIEKPFDINELLNVVSCILEEQDTLH